jgi:hypothetical protein
MAVSVRCACGRVDVFTVDAMRVGWTNGPEGPLCPGCTRFAATTRDQVPSPTKRSERNSEQ